jgi:UMF1 family MFS transporter
MISTKKERFGWYMYDWANSAFSTSVITVFLGPYLTEIAKAAASPDGNISVLGLQIYHGSFFAYIVSISVVLQVIFLPVMGAIADSTKAKKRLLGTFAYIGAFATMGLYFLEGTNYMLGGGLFIIANLCFGVSAVIYNSYLNDIAEPERRDSISSIGWAVGYLGGGIVLGLNLILFMNSDKFGLNTADAVRISLASAGLWWAVFTLFPMILLRRDRTEHQTKISRSIGKSVRTLLETLKDSRNHPKTLILLLAYLFYNDGVQAVIVLSAQFGHQELNITMESLTALILLIQFVAFGGSLLFNLLAKKIGARDSIIFALFLWIGVLLYAFLILQTESEFFVMGIVIGIIMGGTQSLSRSLYAGVIPTGKDAEYFSLYEVSEKGTSWLGPLLFGLSLQLTHSYRLAIFSLVFFFLIGLLLLFKFRRG